MGRGGEGRVMVKRMGRGGSEIESRRGRKRPAGFLLFFYFYFFLCSDKLTMLTHINATMLSWKCTL